MDDMILDHIKRLRAQGMEENQILEELAGMGIRGPEAARYLANAPRPKGTRPVPTPTPEYNPYSAHHPSLSQVAPEVAASQEMPLWKVALIALSVVLLSIPVFLVVMGNTLSAFYCLMTYGLVVNLIGGLWFLGVAFLESPAWGILCIFCNCASLIFLVMHIEKAWKPFVVQLFGTVFYMVAYLLAPQEFMNVMIQFQANRR